MNAANGLIWGTWFSPLKPIGSCRKPFFGLQNCNHIGDEYRHLSGSKELRDISVTPGNANKPGRILQSWEEREFYIRVIGTNFTNENVLYSMLKCNSPARSAYTHSLVSPASTEDILLLCDSQYILPWSFREINDHFLSRWLPWVYVASYIHRSAHRKFYFLQKQEK